jgi:hypothetical protein
VTTEPDAGRDSQDYKPAPAYRPAEERNPSRRDSVSAEATSGPAGTAVSRGWHGWRGWRHSRPFWGGLLVILGGTVTILTERAPLPLVVHIGIQSAAGLLVPIILVLCGLLLWFNAAQRMFYGIVAILLALGTFVTSNLGGFFIGMILGLVGGSLAFAWEPRDGPPAPRTVKRSPSPPRPVKRPPSPPPRLVKRPPPQLPPSGITLILGGSEAEPEADSPGEDTLDLPEVDRPGQDRNDGPGRETKSAAPRHPPT